MDGLRMHPVQPDDPRIAILRRLNPRAYSHLDTAGLLQHFQDCRRHYKEADARYQALTGIMRYLRHGGNAHRDFAAGSSDQSRRPPPVPRIPDKYRQQQPGGQSEQALGVQSRRAKLIYWGERY
ncbi:hypothetical protein Rhopal_006799-T1 [Rhodotorula paludigena]|uniref:Uncharacterized protein n=1 Tax=Rhodotorula paludigena TaxID=86838 RepID=A0AAV5GXH6_9BASI|nr:hypothetical protein Rhopal_006799-T1 [Rhodotorula paludigena]